ncbi:MAG: oxygen-independent coproporphyrinogen III oxidase [Alphaproteobacteria bacterium]|nr:oxygen-independent coproporphyrinogen III oxidase [Alphaproteobacteria bacterium]
MSDAVPVFDAQIVEKYEHRRGSWFTSYPYQSQWQEDPGTAGVDFAEALRRNVPAGAPVALYVHFPYCLRQCLFCQCVMVVSQDRTLYRAYVDKLAAEIALLVAHFEKTGFPNVREVHFGGGSPSILDPDEFRHFASILSPIVDFKNLDECAIEIDPRFGIDADMMRAYHEVGINRISFGIQDFDPAVQKAIARINPPEMIEALLVPEVRALFTGVSFDILYGLPKQTRESHRATMERVLAFAPDRVNVCLLGHRPDIFPHQRAYREEDLPSTEDLVRMRIDTIDLLLGHGYGRIGLDHFAKPHDVLSVAKREGRLMRTVLGYSPGRCETILGVGPSAISTFPDCYTQNYYSLDKYTECLDEGRLPLVRSRILDADDLLRRHVIFAFITHEGVSFAEVEGRFGVDFRETFAEELKGLRELEADGLVEIDDQGIRLTPLGTINTRHVCAAFDRYGRDSYLQARDLGDGRRSLQRSVNHATPP